MYKYLFVLMHVLVITVLIKKKNGRNVECWKGKPKKKANACNFSYWKKMKKKLEALYRILCTYVSKINIWVYRFTIIYMHCILISRIDQLSKIEKTWGKTLNLNNQSIFLHCVLLSWSSRTRYFKGAGQFISLF